MMRRQRTLGRITNCAFTAKAGRTPGPGPYKICLSPLQAKVLFGTEHVDQARIEKTKLGCGAWACVWSLGKDKVVKITRDPDDVAAFQTVGDLKHVRKVYSTYTLIDAGRDEKTGAPVKLWAQIAKEVDPLPKKYSDWVRKDFCRGRVSLLMDVLRQRDVDPKKFKVSKFTRDKITRACLEVPAGERRECQRFGHSLLSTFEKMYHRGVAWIDMHEDNIGMDGKNWVAIDLGVSDIPLKQRPPELRGMGAPRGRKLRRRR